MSALPIKASWAGKWSIGKHSLEQKWAALRFGEVKVETDGEQHVFEVQVYLNDLDPNAVRVELYADGVNGNAPVRQEMKRVRQLAGARAATFTARLCLRPARRRTIRRE